MIPRIHGASLASQGLTLPKSFGVSTRADSSQQFLEPGPRTVNAGFRGKYAALDDSQDRTSIPLFSFAIRTMLEGWDRERLAQLGQYLYDNDGLVGYAIDTIANYCTPITPQPASKDPTANEIYLAYFNDWAKRCDFTGRFNLDTMQRICSKSVDKHADILATMRADHGFPQIDLIEGWRVNSQRVPTSIKTRDGAKIDKDRAVLGYYYVNSDEPIPSMAIPQFVPVDQSILLYDVDRFEDYRGKSPIRRGANDIRDRTDIKGFEKLATKIAAALAGVIEGGSLEENVWDDTDGNKPSSDATRQEKRLTLAQLLGGEFITLPDGQKLNIVNNNRPGERVMDLLDYLGVCFVYGMSVPPSFLIRTKNTGPVERSENGKAQRAFDNRQLMVASLVEWAYLRVIAWGIDRDGLPAVPGWNLMEWQGPPKVSIDEGRDADAWRQDVSKGLMTEQNHFANRNLNWKRENSQTVSEIDWKLKQAEQLAKDHPKVPFESILSRLGFEVPKAAPQPGDNQQQQQGKAKQP